MRMAKLKSEHELGNRYNHDMRIYNVRNADPLKASQNEELVDQLIGRTYADISDETIRNLQQSGAITKKIRKDAVRGLDIFLGFSHEDTPGIDINAWSKRCVEWLQQTFNPPGGMISYTDKDGMEVTQKINNVKSVVLHMDEYLSHPAASLFSYSSTMVFRHTFPQIPLKKTLLRPKRLFRMFPEYNALLGPCI